MSRKGEYSTNSPDYPAAPATPEWRCSHCQGSGKRKKVHSRRKKRDCYNDVKAIILARKQEYLDQKGKDGYFAFLRASVTKEALAVELSVYLDDVHRALMRLNREGLIHQRTNQAPHDSTRDPTGVGDSSWMGSKYYIRLPEEKDND